MSEPVDNNRFLSFVKNIETSLSRLTTLEIKTIVGDYLVDEQEQISLKKGGDFQIMQTRINLLMGDIVTNISHDLVTDRYAWLRDFHARKEEKGHEIVDNNVKAIMSLYELYRKTKSVNLFEENVDDDEQPAI
jgi:hypothetical protein